MFSTTEYKQYVETQGVYYSTFEYCLQTNEDQEMERPVTDILY